MCGFAALSARLRVNLPDAQGTAVASGSRGRFIRGLLRACSSDRGRRGGGVHHHGAHGRGDAPGHVRDATRHGARNAHESIGDGVPPNTRVSTPIRSHRPNSSDRRNNTADHPRRSRTRSPRRLAGSACKQTREPL
jgi:hypothetical protein